jgi:hypothetical protein
MNPSRKIFGTPLVAEQFLKRAPATIEIRTQRIEEIAAITCSKHKATVELPGDREPPVWFRQSNDAQTACRLFARAR